MKKLLVSVILLSITSLSLAEDKLFEQGKAVYDKVCSACHNYGPPPKKAPPMIGISGHYHDAFTDQDKAIAHIVDYIKKPAPEKSMLMPMAIQTWGLMAPLTLPEEDLRAVAYWVWEILKVECNKELVPPPCQRFRKN